MALATTPAIATAYVAVLGDWSKFAGGVAQPAKETGDKLKKEFSASGAASGAAFSGAFAKATAAIGAVAVGVGVLASLKGTITAASDLNETINKSQVIFGKNAAAMKTWSKTAATSFGLSQAAALDAAAGFGNMFQQLGITGNRSTEMSKQIVQLAADLGSFNNVNPADVLRMVSAAMRGEYDELQRLIPNINAARVEHEALAMSHKSSAKELTAAEKATATLAIIQKDGAAAAGDFAKTSDGVANSSRIMAARIEDAKAKFGTALLPAVQATTGWFLKNFIPALTGVIDGITRAGSSSEQFGSAAFKAGDAIRDVTDGVMTGVKWFKDHETITKALVIGLGAYAVVVGTVTAATSLWAAAQTAVDAAIAASPVGWVALAVAALAAVIFLAWQHSETFRTGVLATWEALKPVFAGWMTFAKTMAGLYLALWQNAIKPTLEGIGVASLWLYHTVLAPLFTGWLAFARTAATVYVALWNAIKPVLEGIGIASLWLYNTILKPWFEGFKIGLQVLGAVFGWLLNAVISPFWAGLTLAFSIGSALVKVSFGLMQIAVLAVGALFTWLWDNIVRGWNAAKAAFSVAWAVVSPYFNLIRTALQALGINFSGFSDRVKQTWNAVTSAISNAWNGIKIVFGVLTSAVRDEVPRAFRAGVDAVGSAWNRVRDVAKIPIRFVVETVINEGIIDSYNWLAGTFGIAKVGHVALPKGFATGGLIRGPGTGTSDSILASVAGAGAVRVSNGEYIVPAKSVREFGVGFFDMIAGKRGPQTRKPGDGSEGLAFALGGLVDVTKNAWDYASNPSKITDPLRGLFGRIPGPGLIRDASIGMLHKGVDGLAGVLRKIGENRGHSVASWLAAQKGKPYIWASAGPEGYDCSGIVSAVWNILHDRNPYSHTFSTMDQAGYFPKPGHGFFTAGWANAGEQGGGSVGHTAGNVMGIPFESAGGVGVVVGSGATSVDSFAHVGHYDDGGVIPPGISAVINSSRRPEALLSSDQWRDVSSVAEATRAGDAGGTTINVYPERKDFDIRDLEALQARQDALARLGRPR